MGWRRCYEGCWQIAVQLSNVLRVSPNFKIPWKFGQSGYITEEDVVRSLWPEYDDVYHEFLEVEDRHFPRWVSERQQACVVLEHGNMGGIWHVTVFENVHQAVEHARQNVTGVPGVQILLVNNMQAALDFQEECCEVWHVREEAGSFENNMVALDTWDPVGGLPENTQLSECSTSEGGLECIDIESGDDSISESSESSLLLMSTDSNSTWEGQKVFGSECDTCSPARRFAVSANRLSF